MFIGIANGYGRLYPFCLLSAYQSIFGIAIKPGGGRKTMVDGFMIKTSPDNFQISAALIYIYLPSLKGFTTKTVISNGAIWGYLSFTYCGGMRNLPNLNLTEFN